MADDKDTLADAQIRKIKNHPWGSKLVVAAFVAGSLTALVVGWQKLSEALAPPTSQNNAEQPAPSDKKESPPSGTGPMREPTALIRTIASDTVEYRCSVFYVFPEPTMDGQTFRIERDRLYGPPDPVIRFAQRDEADMFDSDVSSSDVATGFAVSVRAPKETYEVSFLKQLSSTNPNGKPTFMGRSKKGVEIVPGNEYQAAFPPPPKGGDMFVTKLSAAEARRIRTQLGVAEASCK